LQVIDALQGGEETLEPLEMFWPTCNNQQSYGQMDVKHTPPTPHAATPRIQVSNYFTLYFASTVTHR
jgi:hypothetical protein